MKTLLISQDRNYLPFLYKAFQQQEVSAVQMIYQTCDEQFLQQLSDVHAIVFYIESPTLEFTQAIHIVRSRYPNLALLFLFHSMDYAYAAELEKIPSSFYYLHPFNFHKITLDLKYLVYFLNQAPAKKELRVSDLRLNVDTREVFRRNKKIHMQNKEFSLLEFLMSHSGKVFTRNDLLEHVWDHNASLLTNTVDVHVSKLRKKIDGDRHNPLIKTIHCVGYIFDDSEISQN